MRYIDADALLNNLPDDLPYKASVKRVLIQAPTADVVELPCKVGDIVYTYLHLWRKEDGIAPYQITNITITQNKKGEWTKKYRAMEVKNGKTIDWQLNFAFDELGKNVFRTLEEAEKELERSENGT